MPAAARALDLDDDVVAAREPRAVDLPDGGRGQRHLLERLEGLLDREPELLLDGADDLLARLHFVFRDGDRSTHLVATQFGRGAVGNDRGMKERGEEPRVHGIGYGGRRIRMDESRAAHEHGSRVTLNHSPIKIR